MNPLLSKIESYIKLNNRELSFVAGKIKTCKYNKSDFFLEKGYICNKIGIVEEGLLRVYNIMESGNEVTSWLVTENDFICEILSFLNQEPTKEYIRCLEKTTVHYLTYSDLQTLYREIPQMESFGRKLYESFLADIKSYLLSNIHLSAEERYDAFILKYPALIKKVPLKYIASFLGMTDSTLSRVRHGMVIQS